MPTTPSPCARRMQPSSTARRKKRFFSKNENFAVIGAGNIGKIYLDRLLASGTPTENLDSARGAH